MELLCAAAISAVLSIDAFAIGLSCAVRGIRISRRARLTVCIVSAAITSGAVLAGGVLSSVLPGFVGKLMGAVMLFLLGVYITIGALKKDSVKQSSPDAGHENARGIKKALHSVTGILKKPSRCDPDLSNDLDFREAVCLGAALSADSFAAGFGAGLCRSGLYIPVFCAAFQIMLLYVGELVGRLMKKAMPDERILSASSGVLLMIFAVLRLF